MNLKDIIIKNDTVAGTRFDYFIQFLIIVSLVTFSIETIPDLKVSTIALLNKIEFIVVMIFSTEYLLRVILTPNKLGYIFSFYGIIDIIAIVPFYLNTGFDLRSIRIFRLLRVFRSVKLFRNGKAGETFRRAFKEIKGELIMFFAVALFTLYVASVGIYFFENEAQPEKFGSIFHCLWWAVATLTTVGYGDVFPITLGGKIFTSFIVFIGLGIVAVPTGLISSAMTKGMHDNNSNSEVQ